MVGMGECGLVPPPAPSFRTALIYKKRFPYKYKKPTADFHCKFPQQVLQYVLQKMAWINPLCVIALRVNIKRKKITKQDFIKP